MRLDLGVGRERPLDIDPAVDRGDGFLVSVMENLRREGLSSPPR